MTAKQRTVAKIVFRFLQCKSLEESLYVAYDILKTYDIVVCYTTLNPLSEESKVCENAEEFVKTYLEAKGKEDV